MCIFFADLNTFNIPAATPIKKKHIVNNGLVSNQLSKINPIVEPTNTVATNSVLILSALPKDAAFELLLFFCFFIMGVAAGILNVFKSAKKMQKKL